MHKLLFLSAALAAAAFSFVACNHDDPDNTPPTIQIIDPHDGDSLRSGTELHFDADIKDDVMLKAGKVDIHWAEDHDHTKSIAAAATDSVWSVQAAIEGLSSLKNKSVHAHYNIPSNAKEGKYHLVVYVTDEAGNESKSFVTFRIIE